jgi:hypothetical protein
MFRLSKDNIEFNKVAKIVSGEDEGKFLKFIHEPKDNSGYFIFESTREAFDEWPVYDTWYENLDNLIEAVNEDGWLLEWVAQ